MAAERENLPSGDESRQAKLQVTAHNVKIAIYLTANVAGVGQVQGPEVGVLFRNSSAFRMFAGRPTAADIELVGLFLEQPGNTIAKAQSAQYGSASQIILMRTKWQAIKAQGQHQA